MRILITGGSGFIGCNAVRYFHARNHTILNIDKLSYAANPEALEDLSVSERYRFLQADINDTEMLDNHFERFQPEVVLHLAAESHVDRSILTPLEFVRTNVLGTGSILDVANRYWQQLPLSRARSFRFIHISTDEVYGTLGAKGTFSELSPYAPRSPYSASKAGGDHLVMAWHNTYKLPTIISNCSNNYGPYQHREKLIPTILKAALSEDVIPIYGTGKNVRDWIFVEDHIKGIEKLIENGEIGKKYNFGGDNELDNLSLAHIVCERLDKKLTAKTQKPSKNLITLVPDRPGHDYRYAVDSTRAKKGLGWKAEKDFATGIDYTIDWYLKNREWLNVV